jgi:hypothetical protein
MTLGRPAKAGICERLTLTGSNRGIGSVTSGPAYDTPLPPALPGDGLVTHKTYTVRRATVFAGLAWLT